MATSLNEAVDLAEAKLKHQLGRYKDKHALNRRRRLWRRLRRP
jgi:ribosome-associated translation inhibitor RaiA